MMFLTGEELVQLTKKKQRAAQRSVLNALGIQYKVRPDGSLAVMTAHVEKEFGAAPAAGKTKKAVEPNWEALANA